MKHLSEQTADTETTDDHIRHNAALVDEELYRSFIDGMSYGVAYCRMVFEQDKLRDFTYLMANQAFLRLTGLMDIVGKQASEVIPGVCDAGSELLERYGRIASCGEPEHFETFCQPTQRWYQISAFSPQPRHFLIILDDITDRKKAEAALFESETSFRQLADAMPQLVWTASPDGAVDYYNERRHEYSGFTLQEDGEFEWTPVLHPDDVTHTVEAWLHALKKGTMYQAEHRVKLADGSYRWHISRGFPTHNHQGEIVKWSGTATDIHEFKKAQEALGESEERFRTLFENAGDGIFIADSAGRFVDVNARGSEMLGYKRKEMLELTISDIVVAHERARLRSHMQELSNLGSLISEWEFLRQDGSTCIGEVNFRILADGRTISILRDITERREAEERERRLTDLYMALSAVNEAIIHSSSERVLLSALCAIAVKHGGMRCAWVGVPDSAGKFMPVAIDGSLSLSFFESFLVTIDPGMPEGRGPTAHSYRTGEAVFVNRIELSDIMLPWKEACRNHGLHSLATIPIRRSKNVHGAFVVFSDSVDAFNDETVHLLSGMVGNIGYALDNFDRVKERRETEAALRKSEARFRQMADAMPHLVWIARPDGFIEYLNSRCYEYAGYDSSRKIGTENEFWPALIHPDDYGRVMGRFELFEQQPDEPHYDEYRILDRNGKYRWFMERTVPVHDETGQTVRWCGSCTDIHEKKQTEEALKLAAMVYHDSSEAMMVIDADNRIVTVNPAFEKITGHPAGEAIGLNARELLQEDPEHNNFEAIEDALLATGHWKGELWSRRKDGQPIAIHVTANTSFKPDGTVKKRVLLFSDITERKQSDEIIWNQANFDALTGLPNRRFFRERLQHEIRNAKRSGLPMALMFLDLDGFKYVNDTLGHDMGDVLLKEAANRLFGCVRETDTVARMGGDEFTVILPELQDPNNIERIARHILRVLSEPIKLGQERTYVTASVGITLYPQDAADAEELIRNADQAMYAAKEGGKNRYHYFTPGMQEEAIRRMRLISDMRGALEANQFEIVYQPIIELSTGSIHKAEALIRWQHPSKGMVSPIDFIAAAEDTGMITSFGNWIFREAAKQASIWREAHHPSFQISVNISPVQFRNEGIDPSVWFDHLRSLGLPGQGVVVEITEGLLLEASSKVTDQLLMLRDAGIEVALDDFGTGYSSLSYLKKFDIDYIKIDQTFVSNLSEGSDDMALCEAIAVMAHRLGIRVIAEGVETRIQHELLANGGCDFAQGYLFSKPIPPLEFEALLKNNPFAAQEAFNI